MKSLLATCAVAALMLASAPAFAAHVGVPNENANERAGGQASAVDRGIGRSLENGRIDNGFGNAGENGAGGISGAGAERNGSDADRGKGGNR